MLFLVGPHGAGKTMGGKILGSWDFLVFDSGPIVRTLHAAAASGLSLREWIREGELKHGVHFSDKILTQHIQAMISQIPSDEGMLLRDIVIIGHRTLRGIQYFEEHVSFSQSKNSLIIFVESPSEMMRIRYGQREGRIVSHAEFQEVLGRESEDLQELRRHAHHRVLNDGDERMLEAALRKIVFQ